MRFHVLQHVDFEDEAHIGDWARARGHTVSRTLLYAGQALPDVEELDALVVMGGPMNIYEEHKYPFLKTEKEFIRKAVISGRRVLGICLGAQLLSDVLGGKVIQNPVKEIGWFQVRITAQGRTEPLLRGLPDRLTAYHWHGDTFSIPPDSVRIAESDACSNQGFVCRGRVVGFQFHAESTRESVKKLAANCADEIKPGATIQSATEMLRDDGRFPAANAWMDSFLDRWTAMAAAAE